MEKWKAFGQGADVVPGSASGFKDAASLIPPPSSRTSTTSSSSTAPEGTASSVDAEIAKLLKQPANGSGMDALLRAVVYKQWEGLDNHVSDLSFCKMTDKRGCTPLHLTVSHNGPLRLVKSLLKTWPGAATAADADGATALHHAVAKRASTETVATVLEANPEAVKLQSTLKLTVPAGESVAGGGLTQAIATSADATHGFTPLHWALLMRSTEVVSLLLEADEGKQSAAVACAAGRLPLHTAAANEATAATIKAIITAHPTGLKHTDIHGATPLHHAAAHCAPIETMAELSTQNPAAVQAKAKHGWTPLHYLVACGDGSTPEAARLLINSWSGAVTACDDQARTPLHLAVASGAPVAVINALLQRWTGAAAARQQDSGGHTPLHWAAQKSSVAEIVGAVRSAYPSAVSMVTAEGACTPAHLAAARGGDMTVELMSEVLKGEDEHPVLLQQSRHDFTPLHAAVQSGCSLAVIQLLTTLCPKACRIQANKSKGRTPLHIAAVVALGQGKTNNSRDSSSEQSRARSVLLALITADPETVHLLQAFDTPAANAKSRVRGSGDNGAAIVARLRKGDAGEAVREAVEKCQAQGTAASDAKAAELLAMLAKEEAAAEKKKMKSKKKKKKPKCDQLQRSEPTERTEPTGDRIATVEINQAVEIPVQIEQNENDLLGTVPTVTSIEDQDDGGVWITSGKGRKGRRRKATVGTVTTDHVSGQQESGKVTATVTSNSKVEQSTTQAACDEEHKPENYTASTRDDGAGGGGVMRMEELWDQKHKPPPQMQTTAGAPVGSHKRDLHSPLKNIPAGPERQRAGKQLFMEALWGTRGRGSQKWPTDLSRSHYQGFSPTPGHLVNGPHGVKRPESLEACPQCGWKAGSSRTPKHKLLITDPATGAPIVAPPNESAIQAPTGSSNMTEWNAADVCAFVACLLPGSNYSEILREHELDGGSLSALDSVSSKGFELLGITKFGHVHKIASAVARLKAEQTADVGTQQNASPATSSFEIPERKNTVEKTRMGLEPKPLDHLTTALSTKKDSKGASGTTNTLPGSKLESPGKAGGVQSGHDESGLDLPAPPPNEFFCPISFGEQCSVPRVSSRCLPGGQNSHLANSIMAQLRSLVEALTCFCVVSDANATADANCFMVCTYKEMMSEPVVASDGHTYERLEIERWLRNTHQVKGGRARGGTSELSCSSPMTGEPMDGRLVLNEAIKRQIHEYCERHGLPAPAGTGISLPSTGR